MTAVNAPPTIASIKTTAGLEDEDVNYLGALGFQTLQTLSRAAQTSDRFVTRVVDPYIAGTTIAGTEHKATRNAAITEAVLVVAFEEAQRWRATDLASSCPVAAPAAAGSASGAPLMKPPTTLQPGEFNKGVDDWQNKWVPARSFPSQLLLGADVVLGRLKHELRVSKNFTPLGIAEVVSARAHNGDGGLNLARVDKPEQSEIRVTDDGLMI